MLTEVQVSTVRRPFPQQAFINKLKDRRQHSSVDVDDCATLMACSDRDL